jgi:AcrR family transcriptional regulator
MGSGRPPTVAAAAKHAGISQATAYRYFSTQASLLAEAALATYIQPIEDAVAEAAKQADVEEGLARVVQALHVQVADGELIYRRLLGHSLEQPPTHGLDEERERGVGRQGRRLRWLQATLEPLRSSLPAESFDRLIWALTALVGIEALVALRDVCLLSLEEAQMVQEWGARALVREVLRENADRSGPPQDGAGTSGQR